MAQSLNFRPWRLALVAAALALAGAPAQAQTLDAARTFTSKLYAAYGAHDPDYLGRQAGRTFAPELLDLIRRDAAAAKGEVGILDGDPICDCQDPGGLKLQKLAVRAAGPGRAKAAVTLRFPDGNRAMSLDLVAIKGAWRVADVHTKDTPSLVKLLQDGLRAEHH